MGVLLLKNLSRIVKKVFYAPVLLFFMLILFGFTSTFQVPNKDQALGAACALVIVFTLLPYIILAWLNGIKNEK